MSHRPFQFRIATLMWLVFAAAILMGTMRYARSSGNNSFKIILIGAFFLTPLIWLFLRPNPYRGRRNSMGSVRTQPPGPIEHRLRRFMANVLPAQGPPSSECTTRLVPQETQGKPPRRSEEIGAALKRIGSTF